MTLDKIIKEIEDRIQYLEKKKNQLIILEITSSERHIREEKIDLELNKLSLMLHYSK